MRATTRRTISMARRALDFASALAITDAGFTTVVARLKDEVSKADQLGRLQGEGAQREHAAVQARAAIRAQIRTQQLRRLTKLAELNAAEHPELIGRYDLPDPRGPNRAFLLQLQSVLSSATEQKDLLAQLGAGDTIVADLTSAIATFDTATANAHAARADHVGASGELAVLARRCDNEVTLIDTYVRSVFADDTQTLAAWQSARNRAGPFRHSHTADPVPSPEPVPAPEPASIPVVDSAKAA